jgi:hypothetical protein
MKNLIRIFLLLSFIGISTASNAQLLDGLFNKEKKEKKKELKSDQKEEKKDATSTVDSTKFSGEIKPVNNIPEATSKKFTYKCYTLNTDVESESVKSCANNNGEKMVTDMQYYEQGEDLRVKETNNSTLVLSFLDDTKRLIGISVEDIEDINYVKQLQQMILDQMGNPTQGYEVMKNYDGNNNAPWADYSTYEFYYRYSIGNTVYDFQVTQFGAKSKDGKIIHPYSFSANVGKKKDATDNTEETKTKGNFYPTTGVQEVNDYSVETQMLRKW